MGIPGIYKQIGPGERIALSKLAVEHLETRGRPLRIAIDISIWSFQIQSGHGGKNPALRTLYYRLLRLLALSIQPLFVFDGPHKPPFKRGKKTAPGGACLPDFVSKELLKRFGFPYHTAPGEAEAECALLQKENIVDAVLSEDVDTLMFGCRMTLRNWTAEGVRGNKSPTHVNVYNAESTMDTSRLDSNGMILVALMSGGDYVPAGVPGCGIKTACEAAKAGFGEDLCRLSRRDTEGFRQWRRRIEHELQTNESKLFRQKHKAIKIPETFPDMTVLGYYTHPAVSSSEKVSKIRDELTWDLDVNITELRLFVAEAFNWAYLSGANKFIRGLAPALLAHRLIQRSGPRSDEEESLETKEVAEAQVVKAICDRRSHWNTDGSRELRIAYVPNGIVGIDIDAEEKDDPQGYAQDGSGDEHPASDGEDAKDRSRSPTKRRGPLTYDPMEVEKIWVLETYVKLGVPLLVENWEEDMQNPKQFTTRKAREKKTLSKAKAATNPGAMDQFVKTSKPGVSQVSTSLSSKKDDTDSASIFLAPAIASYSQSPQRRSLSENRNPVGRKMKKLGTETAKASKPKAKNKPIASQTVFSPPRNSTTNPWTLSKRPMDTVIFKSPTRYSALGICAPDDPEYVGDRQKLRNVAEKKQQSLASPPPSPVPTKRRSRPTTPISDSEHATPSPRLHASVPQGLATPTTHHSARPSPRKKRSPLELANELYVSGKLRTPASIRKESLTEGSAFEDEESLTAKRVNRRLDFTTPQSMPSAASLASDTSSLLSHSTLLSPPISNTIEIAAVGEIPAPETLISPLKVDQAKKFFALRESLEGAWKHLEPWEVGTSARMGVFGSVEVLDLTRS